VFSVLRARVQPARTRLHGPVVTSILVSTASRMRAGQGPYGDADHGTTRRALDRSAHKRVSPTRERSQRKGIGNPTRTPPMSTRNSVWSDSTIG
jgi:hypothetical protein